MLLLLWANVLLFFIFVYLIYTGKRDVLIVGGGILVIVLLTTTCFFSWFGIMSVLMIIAAALYYAYHVLSAEELQSNVIAKKEVEEEKDRLSSQFKIKEESFNTLKNKVDDLFQLFEVAKEFNETLELPSILRILTDKLMVNLPYKRGTLVLLAEKDMEQKSESIFAFSESQWEEREREERFNITILLDHIEQNRHTIKIQQKDFIYSDFICGEDIESPVWIFPLIVEEKIIAIIIFEGGQEIDYSKFLIIAGHLALQIQKITLYRTVKELSITDGLTGVFLRRHFIERFNEEIKRSLRNEYNLSVLMLDIDYFKGYNDTYGHLVGDVTLREVAKIIKESVRKVDLICRYGGEEFAIVLPETDITGGIEVAERIRAAVSKKKFEVYDEETHVTVSIGITSLSPEPGDTEHIMASDRALELLQKADQALYNAKAKGRNIIEKYTR